MTEKVVAPAPARPEPERNFGLDLMRACAIIMVFLSHTNPINPLNPLFPWFGWLGCGVEAFFVLSGFLIGRIILRTLFKPGISWNSVRIFWVNRWLRTIPAYLVAIGIEYLFTDYTRHAIFYLFFAQNLFTPMLGFFPHSWSLAVEEWFYLLFPLSLLAIAYLFRMRSNRDRVYLLVACGFIIFGIFTKFSYHLMYENSLFPYLVEKRVLMPSWKTMAGPIGNWNEMRKIVPFRIDAIAYGCLLAYLMNKFSLSARLRSILLFLGVSGLVGCFIIMDHTVAGIRTGLLADVFLLPFFCCSFAFMLPAAESCPRPAKFLNAAITNLSHVSYSFYLLHLLIVDKAIALYQHDFADVPKWVVFTSTFISIYIAASLMYRFVELPFMNYRKTLFRKTPFNNSGQTDPPNHVNSKTSAPATFSS